MAGGSLRNLMVRIDGNFSGMQRSMGQAQSVLGSFAKSVKGTLAGVGLAFGGLELVNLVKDATKTAMGVEGQTVLINRLLGESADSFLKWAETGAMAFGISKQNAISYGSIFMSQLKGISNGTDDLKNKTEKLLEITSVMASQSSYDLNTVMEKVSSGLRGETDAIEDLGVQVTATTLQSTNAFKVFGQGARTWDQITSDTVKKQIMYYGILEQATSLYGNTLADTTQTKMMIFRAELQNVQLALGSAFLPIMNVVLPILSRFASWLNRTIQGLSTFFQVLFGHKKKIKDVTKTFDQQTKTTNKQSASVGKLGNTFTNTGKKVKKAVDTMKQTLAGFDALNILNLATSSSGGDTGSGGSGGTGGTGGTGGIDGGGINIPTDPKQTEPSDPSLWEIWAERVKKALEPLKESWDKIKYGLQDLWDALGEFWNSPAVAWLRDFIMEKAVQSLKGQWDLFANSLHIVADVIRIITDVINGDWGKAWDDTKQLLKDVMNLIKDYLQNLFPDFKEEIETAGNWWRDKWIGMLENVGKFFDDMKKIKWSDIVKSIKDVFTSTEIGETIWNNVTSAFKNIDVKKWFTDSVLGKVISAFSGTGIGAQIWKNVKDYFNGVDETDYFKDIKENVAKAFGGTGIGWTIWKNIKDYFISVDEKKWFIGVKDNVAKAFSGTGIGSTIWSNIKGYFTSIGGKSITSWFSNNVASPIRNAFSKVTNGLGSSITSAFKTVFNAGAGYINKVIDLINKMIGKLNKLPKVNIPKIDYKIPKLAKGGVIDRPTFAQIGEDGKEVVMPLERNTGWIDQLAGKIAGSVGSGSGGSGGMSGDIIVQVGGSTLGRITASQMNRLNRQAGKRVFGV